MEAAIDILRDEQDGCPRLVTDLEDFNEKYCKIIMGHYLCKFDCFYLHLTHLMEYSSPWRSSFWVGTKEWNKVYLAAKVEANNS